MSQPKETLSFRIGLSGTFWAKAPHFSILLDGLPMIDGFAGLTETTYYEFQADIEEDKEHTLEIKFINKSDSDTILNEDKTAIIKDMLLNIDSIEIDEIDINELKWTASEFIADDPARPTLTNCVNLGWNGSYRFKFTSPFYLWLLENM